MRYVSTRGQAPVLGFEDVLMTGLAADGGLYVPESCPHLGAVGGGSYLETAQAVMTPFLGGDLAPETLAVLLRESYAAFRHSDITPLRRLDDNLYVLELFHGPTLAFKDVALQFLGRLFTHVLAKRGRRVTIIGATSGDTGSAAIEAFRDRANADIFILHPKGRVSDVQRRQMTTVLSDNVHNISIDGTFDDCQDMVKALFADAALRAELDFSAVNSINWARILAQIVYYVQAGNQVLADCGQAPAFCVPTGNFGNVYAGYIARQAAAPVGGLVVATNRNDILHRFFETGEMRRRDVQPSLSPSMDIQVSSNFERLLFDLCGRDAACVRDVMARNPFSIGAAQRQALRGVFSSGSADDAATSAAMARVYSDYGYLCDPHTAVGMHVAAQWRRGNPDTPLVCLATAHPAKFPDAVQAATGVFPPLPDFLSGLFDREERCTALPNDLGKVKDFIRLAARARQG